MKKSIKRLLSLALACLFVTLSMSSCANVFAGVASTVTLPTYTNEEEFYCYVLENKERLDACGEDVCVALGYADIFGSTTDAVGYAMMVNGLNVGIIEANHAEILSVFEKTQRGELVYECYTVMHCYNNYYVYISGGMGTQEDFANGLELRRIILENALDMLKDKL